jgi:hypothetical protein
MSVVCPTLESGQSDKCSSVDYLRLAFETTKVLLLAMTRWYVCCQLSPSCLRPGETLECMKLRQRPALNIFGVRFSRSLAPCSSSPVFTVSCGPQHQRGACVDRRALLDFPALRYAARLRCCAMRLFGEALPQPRVTMTYRSPAFLCTCRCQLQYFRCARTGFSIGCALVAFLRQHVPDWTQKANISGRFKTPLHPCALNLHSGAERRATTLVPPI